MVREPDGPGTVAVAVVDGHDIPPYDLYEVSIACLVFGAPQPDLADPWYDMRLCAVPSAPTAGDVPGFGLRTPYGMGDLVDAHTVVVPGLPEECVLGDREVPPDLVDALRTAHDAGSRIVALCTGAFALAAAGLLDGRRATAHWMHAAVLADRYPAVHVDPSVLYVDDGDVLTSAGITAGLDLCLHIVRTDLGAHVANQLARRLVVPPHRVGGQAQFVDRAVPVADSDPVGPALQWAVENLDRALTVRDMARHAGVSARTLHRQLRAATGRTPLQWLLTQRLARAQALLESTDLAVELIGERCGLGTANNLRRQFALHVGVPPREYRRAFRASRRPGHPDRPSPPAVPRDR